MSCPRCESVEFATERRPDGDNICMHCSHRWKNGRPIGKTREAAQLVAYAARRPHARIALVSKDLATCRRMALMVMAESPGGTYGFAYHEVTWSNGAVARLYSCPEQLYGERITLAWAHQVSAGDLRATLRSTLDGPAAHVVDTWAQDQLEA